MLIADTIIINSTLLSSIFTFGFNINAQNSNNILCKLNYYAAYLITNYFPVLLILATIDRLFISSQNVDTRLYSSRRLAYFATSTSLFICMIFYLHIFIKVSLQELYPGVFICAHDLSTSYQDFLFYTNIIFGLGLTFIIFLLSCLSFKNVRHIRAVGREKQNQIRSMTKKDFQLLRCLYVYDIVYSLSSVLGVIKTIYGVIYPTQKQIAMQQALYNFFYGFGAFIHFIPYCANFFIFLSVSKAFRQEFKRLGYRICCRDLQIVHEEDQRREIIGRENVDMNNVHVSTINSHY